MTTESEQSYVLRLLAYNNRIRKIFHDPKTTYEQKKKICKELSVKFKGDPAYFLPVWCNSSEATSVKFFGKIPGVITGTKTGYRDLDDLSGGKRRQRTTTRRAKLYKRGRTIRRSLRV